MPNKPILRYGDTGESVKEVQAILQSQGHFDGKIGGNFLAKTFKAVKYFQQTHQGPDGEFLPVTGQVDPPTWWALENASGDAQRSFIDPRIPDGLSAERNKILGIALGEHGNHEIPDGSNRGDGVDKYIKGFGPIPWCAAFTSWVYKEATGKYPLGKNHVHCLTFWREANKAGKAHAKDKYQPIPGDFFIMLYKTKSGQLSGSGHIGFVLSVAKDYSGFNTIEGNTGNRVKVGTRWMGQSTLHGFVNLFDNDREFDKVLLSSKTLESSHSSTR